MSEWMLHGMFALGGGLGAAARFLLTTHLTHRYPLSTLIVNVLGCFLLGLSMTVLWDAAGLHGEQERRIYAGFCGGFTTFSAFAYQSLALQRSYSVLVAALNVLVSLALCVLSFLAGRWAGGTLN